MHMEYTIKRELIVSTLIFDNSGLTITFEDTELFVTYVENRIVELILDQAIHKGLSSLSYGFVEVEVEERGIRKNVVCRVIDDNGKTVFARGWDPLTRAFPMPYPLACM